MENRIQYFLLNAVKASGAVALLSAVSAVCAQNADTVTGDASLIDREFFEFGFNAGIMNIEDFGSEPTMGANFTFKATEDFFLQFNYLQANAALSSYEKSQGQLFSGSDRDFKHFDLLLGYKIFQGEFFTSGASANLSSLYLIGGVGDTTFGGEASFTYTVGIGYEVALSRRFILRADYRDYIYESNLIDTEGNITHNGGLSVGLNYLF